MLEPSRPAQVYVGCSFAVREAQPVDLGGRLWRTKQIALHFGAAEPAKQFLLLLRFNALRGRRHVACRGDIHYRLHNAGTTRRALRYDACRGRAYIGLLAMFGGAVAFGSHCQRGLDHLAAVTACDALGNRNGASAAASWQFRRFHRLTTSGHFERLRAGHWDRCRDCPAPYSGSSRWGRKRRNNPAQRSPAAPGPTLRSRSTERPPRQEA